jgi:hypothetical protein
MHSHRERLSNEIGIKYFTYCAQLDKKVFKSPDKPFFDKAWKLPDIEKTQ